MSTIKGLFAALACSCLALVTGCSSETDYDENGVDYVRAGDTGYARVTFTLVRPNGATELLPVSHHLYLDESATIPLAGGLAHAHVPEDRGELGYRVVATDGAAAIAIVDFGKRTADGEPTELYQISCRRDIVNAVQDAAFDSPNRGADGSFVRLEVVDLRHALCGRGTLR